MLNKFFVTTTFVLVFTASGGGLGLASALPRTVEQSAKPSPAAGPRHCCKILVTLGDSITAIPLAGEVTDANIMYPHLLSQMFHASLYDYAVGGETSFPHQDFYNGTTLLVAHSGIAAQAEKVPQACADAGEDCIVTIYIGTNDEFESNMPNSPAYRDPAGAYHAAVSAAVAIIRLKAPSARIAAATVPNHDVPRGTPTIQLISNPA